MGRTRRAHEKDFDHASYRVSYQRVASSRLFTDGAGGLRFAPTFSNLTDIDGRIDTVNARTDFQLGRFNLISAGYEFERENYSSLAQDQNPDPSRRTNNFISVTQRSNAFFVQDQLRLLDGRSYSRAEVVQQFQSAGAPAFRFANFDRIEDIKENIRIVGRATGDDAAAKSLIAQMDDELARIKARIPQGTPRPRVMSYSPAGYTAGANTLFDDIIRTAGATNVTADNGLDGFRKISAEQVAAWQPDFIVNVANAARFDDARRELLANPAIAATPAGRNYHIVIMDTRYFLTVSHHVVRAVDELTKELYKDANAR